jgi:hypothetical protein
MWGRWARKCIINTYLWSIFASNTNNPKEEGRDLPKQRDVPAKGTIVGGCRQQKLTQHLLSWPQRRSANKRTECLVLQKIILKDSTKANSKSKYLRWISKTAFVYLGMHKKLAASVNVEGQYKIRKIGGRANHPIQRIYGRS